MLPALTGWRRQKVNLGLPNNETRAKISVHTERDSSKIFKRFPFRLENFSFFKNSSVNSLINCMVPSVNFLVLIMYYRYVKFCHQGKLGGGSMGLTCIIFATSSESIIISKLKES